MIDYALIDSGEGQKLERFGKYLIQRPCAAALWSKKSSWKPDARFTRDPDGRWEGKLPDSWVIKHCGVRFELKATDFGHLGVFPEHAAHWQWMQNLVKGKDANILNLFAYSGGATLSLAQAGAKVCHVDASKGMVSWARKNAALNQLEDAPIRWIVDDALKFLKREIKRGNRYEGVILDPPTYGRGKQGQVFKIEKDLPELLDACNEVLSDRPLFTLLSCHTPGITPLALHHLLKDGDYGEMTLTGEDALPVPSGSFARRTYA